MRACPHSHVTLTVLMAILPAITSFLLLPGTTTTTTPSLQPSPPLLGVVVRHSFTAIHTGIAPRSRQSRLYDYMSVVDSTDDLLLSVLNLPPTADQREIKRAYYKRMMAFNYHPDVITHQDSDSPPVSNEKDKTSTTDTSSVSSSTYYNEYARPNRRTSTTRNASSSRNTHHDANNQASTNRQIFQSPPPPHHDFNVNQALTDWKEYVHLVQGGAEAAAAVVGAGTRDSVKSFQGRRLHGDDSSMDVEWQGLLTTTTGGSVVQRVSTELRDAELVVQQLNWRRKSLMEEQRMRQQRQADYHCKTGPFYLYLEKKELDEHVARLDANIRVVEEDYTRARQRWMALQTRHEQLLLMAVETTHDHNHGSSSSSSSSQSTSLYSRTTFSPLMCNASSTASSACSEEDISSSRSMSFPHSETRAATAFSSSETLVSSTPPPPRQESSSINATSSSNNGSTTLASFAPPPLRQEYSSTIELFSNGRTQKSSVRQGTSSNGSNSSRSSSSTPPPAQQESSLKQGRSSDDSASSSPLTLSDNDAWKHEGFASSSRGRGSSRRRRSHGGDTESSNGSTASSSSEEESRKHDGFTVSSFLKKARDSLVTFMMSELLGYAERHSRSSSSSPSTSMASLGTTSSSSPSSSTMTTTTKATSIDGSTALSVALKLVKFSSSIERKQTVLTRTAEQQTVKEKKPVIDYEKVEASFLQNQLGQLNQTSMETLRLAGYTDVEEKSLSLDPIHHEILAPIEASRAELIVAAIESAKETFVGSIGRARSERSKKEGTRGHLFHVEILAPTEDARAESIVAALENAKETLVESVRRTQSKEAKKKKDDANKRVVLLTRHIRVLEAHKKKLPTGYYKADNAKGDVLGSLCSVFSIPAKKMDGTPNKADDKRLAIREILGAESPRTAFDSALEDLKQQLVCAKKGKQDEMAKKGNRDDLSATRKKKGNSKKRAVWLTKHISVLEVHKTKLPTGYWMAENAKGGVLGSLCSIFSIPFTKNDGTSNNADDKRLAIREILGAESPRTVFDDTLEDLKQQLVSEMITAAS